jgi:hypothetical protein
MPATAMPPRVWKAFPGNQRAVTGIQKRQMPRCVAWTGDGFQRANALTRLKQARGARGNGGIGAAQPGLRLVRVQAALAREKARIAGRDHHFGLW